jgi:hypothetical protein
MRIRPGRGRSILAGIMAIVVTLAGLWLLTSFGRSGPFGGGLPTAFVVVWVLLGLAGAAAAFYNAFSKRGLPLYEVDMDDDTGEFCPQCGKPVGPEDEFCRHCGASLE